MLLRLATWLDHLLCEMSERLCEVRDLTKAERVKRHYNEAVDCLNAVGSTQHTAAGSLTAAPLLIQTAIAHALLGQLLLLQLDT